MASMAAVKVILKAPLSGAVTIRQFSSWSEALDKAWLSYQRKRVCLVWFAVGEVCEEFVEEWFGV